MEKSKSKNKIIIISVAILTVILLGVAIFLAINEKRESKVSKTNKLLEELKSMNEYAFITKIDKKNGSYYAKKDGKAYMMVNYDGDISEYVIKDGNTYLIQRDNKVYYKYENNQIDLNKIEEGLEIVKEEKMTTGKEKINDKAYSFEEYNKPTILTFLDTSEGGFKTKFYYEKDQLKYIKTYNENNKEEELASVEIEDKVEDELFDIPSDFEEK